MSSNIFCVLLFLPCLVHCQSYSYRERCGSITHPSIQQNTPSGDNSGGRFSPPRPPETRDIGHLERIDLRRTPFVKSVVVQRGCQLSLKSAARPGESIEFIENFPDLSQVGYRRLCVWWRPWDQEQLSEACCQCGGCDLYRNFRPEAWECAKAFETENCSECPSSGQVHTLRIGQEHRRCWDSIQSIAIRPGCRATLFNSENFGGESTTLYYSGNFNPGRGWQGKRVCSFRCECPIPTIPPYTTTTTTTTTRRPSPEPSPVTTSTTTTTERITTTTEAETPIPITQTTWQTPYTKPTESTTTPMDSEEEEGGPIPVTPSSTTTEEPPTTWPTPFTKPPTEDNPPIPQETPEYSDEKDLDEYNYNDEEKEEEKEEESEEDLFDDW